MKFKPFDRKKTEKTERHPTEQIGRTPVYSYHSLRDNRTDKREGSILVDSTPAPLWERIIKFFSWAVIIGLLLFLLWLKPVPKATLAAAPGTISRDINIYQAGLNEIWSRSLLNRTKATIPTHTLEAAIKQRFPEVARVSIELPLIGQLPNVILVPDQPVLIVLTQKGGFYLSESGKTLARSDEVTGNALGGLPTVRDDSGLVPEPGKNGLPRQTIQTVTEILRLAASAGLDVETLVLPPAPNEVVMNIKHTPYMVKFSLDHDPRQGIGALIALRDKFKSENISPTTYVDLRIPDKAFYK